MSLITDIQAYLPRFREQAESLMTDTCTISGGTEQDFNETTLEYETVETVVYDGPCRLKFAATAVQDVEAAGQTLIVQSATLSLPVATSTAVKQNHIATMTNSVNDPGLIGVQFRIEGPHHQSFATARRFPVQEVNG